MRDVFDKSFLGTIYDKSTHSMFNNGQSKHRMVTLKKKAFEKFADSLNYITKPLVENSILVDKHGT